ncbi:MAG TPA: hypothetical protein VGM89_01890 [Puia sp.]
MKTVLMAMIFLLVVSGATAQTASAWNLNGGLTATTTGTGITAGSVSLGSAIVSGQFNSSTEYFGQDGWPSGALDVNAYLQFSVGPSSGFYVKLNSVTLAIRHSTLGTSAGSGPLTFSLRSSLDGYATDLMTGTLTTTYQNFTVTLPSAFQALMSSVSFRVYGYNQVTTTGGSNRFVFDNISVAGSSTAGTLAIRSIELKAKHAGSAVGLQWQADGADAGTLYRIQRSGDGAMFTVIGETDDPGFTDASTSTASQDYYRVEAQQPDGSSIYSNIVRVSSTPASTGSIRWVAAAGSSVQTLVHLTGIGTSQVSIESRDGKVLYRERLEAPSGDKLIQLSAGIWPHGVYILTLSDNGENSSRLFTL